MTRPVRVFEPLWFDRTFRKSLKALPQPQQKQRLEEIAALTVALGECRHPTHDPALAAWRPTAYHVSKVPPEIRLFEYRGRFPLRIIARWLEPSQFEPEGAVLLVALTLTHDHERLQEMIRQSRSELKDWP